MMKTKQILIFDADDQPFVDKIAIGFNLINGQRWDKSDARRKPFGRIEGNCAEPSDIVQAIAELRNSADELAEVAENGECPFLMPNAEETWRSGLRVSVCQIRRFADEIEEDWTNDDRNQT